jgi:hypothetical protein
LHRLKLATASRDDLGLKSVPHVSLDLEKDESVTRDIKAFIKTELDELARMVDFDAERREMTEDMVMQCAGGTFLWVGFAIAELLRQSNLTNIKASLGKLPEGLPGIYRRILFQTGRELRLVGDEKASLVHQSAKDYPMWDDGEQDDALEIFRIKEEVSNRELTS